MCRLCLEKQSASEREKDGRRASVSASAVFAGLFPIYMGLRGLFFNLEEMIFLTIGQKLFSDCP